MFVRRNTECNRKSGAGGFTLIELLVAMAIMAILTTLVLARYREADKRRRVQLAGDMLVSALSDTQNSALTGKKATGCTGGNPYVARLIPNATTVNVGCLTNTYQTYNLPAQTIISTVTMDGISYPNGIFVYFYPPFATVKVCTSVSGVNCTATETNFTTVNVTAQSSNNPSITRTTLVDGVSGRIE
jgi:prepilin-type N-terminal cleavage/methylation domain-containing protein